MVHAFANELNMQFISVKGTQIFSCYFGESEAAIRRLFSRARQIAPCLIFIDEIDVLGSSRESDSTSGIHKRVLSQMLNEMDGVQSKKQIIVVGCTNKPQKLDSAILRPGRLDKLVYVSPPSFEDRLKILNNISQMLDLSEDVSLDSICKMTLDYSCSSLYSLFREAISIKDKNNLNSLGNENSECITQSIIDQAHFNLSLDSKFSSYKPFTKEHLFIYESFLNKQKK